MCCAVLCLVTQSCPTLCDAMDCSWSDSSVHGDSPGKNTGGSCHALLQAWDLPNSGIEPRSPTLQADSLLFEPPNANSNEHSVPLLSSFFVLETVFGDIHYLNYNNS